MHMGFLGSGLSTFIHRLYDSRYLATLHAGSMKYQALLTHRVHQANRFSDGLRYASEVMEMAGDALKKA